MDIKNQFIILSAERFGLSIKENLDRNLNLVSSLDELKIIYRRIFGVYENNSEISYLCLVINQEDIELLKGFAFKNFEQESILYQDVNGLTTLIFKNGDTQKTGKLREVKTLSKGLPNDYSIFNGKMYITKW